MCSVSLASGSGTHPKAVNPIYSRAKALGLVMTNISEITRPQQLPMPSGSNHGTHDVAAKMKVWYGKTLPNREQIRITA